MGRTSWEVGINTLRPLGLVLLLDTVDRGAIGEVRIRDNGGKVSLESLYIRVRTRVMQSGQTNRFEKCQFCCIIDSLCIFPTVFTTL